ncbi:MAG: cytidine deaminase [Halobacteriovoraceae bacterium]|nr:cytidine deaminase [Halobacteriovoraceae bacterium]
MDEKFAKKALELAKEIRQKAYAPYSKFQVGTVIKLAGDEKLYSGCNIENASFGGCMCAERVSLYKAYTESPAPKKLVEKVLLITDNPQYDVPCGLCLQVLSEFSDQNTEIYLANLKGVVKTLKFSQLLPESFSKESLPGHKS